MATVAASECEWCAFKQQNVGSAFPRGHRSTKCGIAAANEIFVLPGSAYREPDADYCISFVIPKDIEGLTIVTRDHAFQAYGVPPLTA